jgi:alanine racemase
MAHIDLDAFARNFRSSKEFIGFGVKYLAVVKADAYGHGAVECSRRLESEGVDWLGVAIPEEGVELRQNGIKAPILCLGSFWPGQEYLVVDYGLTPVVFSQFTAECLHRLAVERGLTLDIHVKIDTGMGRVGVRWPDAGRFAKKLAQMSRLRIVGIMTHFASADDPAEESFTQLQISRFNEACDKFQAEGHSPEFFDMANSPGAIIHPASRGNLVRLGGALYGLLDDILPLDSTRPKLEPVLSLSSKIADMKTISTGESLGYGRTFLADRETIVASIPIGYADGYPRSLSNRGSVLIHGKYAPIVGRISMDWTLVDVTDVEGANPGDTVTLVGKELTACRLAAETGTIGYEITCGISPRVPRVYK